MLNQYLYVVARDFQQADDDGPMIGFNHLRIEAGSVNEAYALGAKQSMAEQPEMWPALNDYVVAL